MKTAAQIMIDLLRTIKYRPAKVELNLKSVSCYETYRIWSWFREVSIDIVVWLGRHDKVMG